MTPFGMAVLIGGSAPIWAIIVVYIAGQIVGMIMRQTTSAMVVNLSPKDRLTNENQHQCLNCTRAEVPLLEYQPLSRFR